MMSQPTCAGSIHRPQAPPVLPPLVRLVAARAAHGAEHARTSTSTVMSPQTCHMRRHSAAAAPPGSLDDEKVFDGENHQSVLVAFGGARACSRY